MRSKAKKSKPSKPETRTTAAGIEVRTSAGWVLVQRDGWPDAHWDIRAAHACNLGRDLPDLIVAAFDRLREHLERGELIEVPQSNWSTPEGRKRLARRLGQPVKWRLNTMLADLGNGEKAYGWNAAKAPAVGLLVAFLQHAGLLAQMDCPASPRDAVFFELGAIAEAARLRGACGTAAADGARKAAAAAGRTETASDEHKAWLVKIEETFRIRAAATRKAYSALIDDVASILNCSSKTVDRHLKKAPEMVKTLKQLAAPRK